MAIVFGAQRTILTTRYYRGANFEDRGGLKANLESCKLIVANLGKYQRTLFIRRGDLLYESNH